MEGGWRGRGSCLYLDEKFDRAATENFAVIGVAFSCRFTFFFFRWNFFSKLSRRRRQFFLEISPKLWENVKMNFIRKNVLIFRVGRERAARKQIIKASNWSPSSKRFLSISIAKTSRTKPLQTTWDATDAENRSRTHSNGRWTSHFFFSFKSIRIFREFFFIKKILILTF